jgi:hypothetical protein
VLCSDASQNVLPIFDTKLRELHVHVGEVADKQALIGTKDSTSTGIICRPGFHSVQNYRKLHERLLDTRSL